MGSRRRCPLTAIETRTGGELLTLTNAALEVTAEIRFLPSCSGVASGATPGVALFKHPVFTFAAEQVSQGGMIGLGVVWASVGIARTVRTWAILAQGTRSPSWARRSVRAHERVCHPRGPQFDGARVTGTGEQLAELTTRRSTCRRQLAKSLIRLTG